MKISALPLLDPAVMDGTEDLPIVKGLTTYRSTPGNVVDAAFGPLASALAVALGNYRATYAQAVADLAVGQMFASDASGTMSLYRRISAAPGYQYYDDVVTASLARARTVSVDLAANIATRRLDASVVAIITGGHTVAGIGAATYVCDGLANAALALAYPALCKVSGDGRYWRLMPQRGALAIEQAGAIPNDATKAVGNVTASRAVLAYLSAVCGGGTLASGAGLFTFDAVALGTTGLALPSNITVRGAGVATIWAASVVAPGYQLSGNAAPGVLLTAVAGATNVRVCDIELRGLISLNGAKKGEMRNCNVTGPMTSKAQYAETGISFVAAMADGVRSYSDTSKDTATDIGTTADAFADATIALAGNVLSVTPTMTTQLGYYRYAVSDFVDVDPTKAYIVRYLNGFFAGRGGACQRILLYDANKNPVSTNQATTPSNYFESSLSDKTDYTSAAIQGARYLRLEVGAFKGADGVPGLTASFDLSCVQILEVVNDSKGWLAHMAALTASGGSAAAGTSDSPANHGQITLTNCFDFHVRNCDLRMIDRAAISMTSCTSCTISNNVIDYAMQGVVDSWGRFNRIDANLMDGRFLTTAGLTAADEDAARIGARAFRIRGVGGSNCDKLQVTSNHVRGFSWGMEIILYSLDRECYLANNVVESEFSALSLFHGVFMVDNPVLRVASDAIHALECPGQDTAPDTQIAVINNPDIRFTDFAPNGGVGISSTAGLSVAINGGFIRAPLGVQLLGSANSSMQINGTRFEYGWCAVLGRGGPMQVKSPSMVPWVKTPNTRGSGQGSQSGPINIQPVDPTARIDVEVGHLETANNSAAFIANVQSLRLCLPDIVTPLANFPNQYIKLVPPAGAVSWMLERINFRALPSTVYGSSWAAISANPATGSRITMQGCRVNQSPALPPANVYTRAYLAGDPWLVSFALGNITLGSVVSGNSVPYTVSVPGAAVGFSKFSVVSSLSGGLSGLTVDCIPTADDTVLLTISNLTSGTITKSTGQTLIITGQIVR